MGLNRGLLDTTEVGAVIDAFEESDWQELRLQVGDTVVHLARSGGYVTLVDESGAAGGAEGGNVPVRLGPSDTPPPAPQVEPAGLGTSPPALSKSEAAASVTIRSPTLGLFWRARHPGAAPFVEVGDPVEPDTTLCIVEVMKLMNPLKAGVRGIVAEIMAADGEVLARDQVLFVLRPLEP